VQSALESETRAGGRGGGQLPGRGKKWQGNKKISTVLPEPETERLVLPVLKHRAATLFLGGGLGAMVPGLPLVDREHPGLHFTPTPHFEKLVQKHKKRNLEVPAPSST
jgi:hypothetical protein